MSAVADAGGGLAGSAGGGGAGSGVGDPASPPGLRATVGDGTGLSGEESDEAPAGGCPTGAVDVGPFSPVTGGLGPVIGAGPGGGPGTGERRAPDQEVEGVVAVAPTSSPTAWSRPASQSRRARSPAAIITSTASPLRRTSQRRWRSTVLVSDVQQRLPRL